MSLTAKELSDGAFKPDGTYDKTFHGIARRDALIAAFTTIEGQHRWSIDVKSGAWISGTPGTVGSIRELKHGGTLWSRHQLTEIAYPRIRYVFIETGGGMPMQQARVEVTITAPDDGAGPASVRFDFRYKLGFAFRLMKDFVNQRVCESLDKGLPRLFV